MTPATTPPTAPLAHLLRPKKLADFLGLKSLDKSLVKQLETPTTRPPSAILWGPPGSGKTTLARIIGEIFNCEFVELSAVLAGVKDVRQVVEEAKERDKPTLLFVDEIHRFNRGQQDAFLPHVEAGTISLIGATTENPSFYLTGALLSRCRVIVLPALSREALTELAVKAAQFLQLDTAPSALNLFVDAAVGDGRRLLNLIEGLPGFTDKKKITEELAREFLEASSVKIYDREGEEHYNTVSAFIKSMRGSDADAALYYAIRMLESGEEPRFVIRRMIIFASEDIGNADPRALQIAISTLQAFENLGLPEGRIPIAQCVTYLATAPKSNRSYVALNKILEVVKRSPGAQIPLHLRNAPTKLMKNLGYGSEYRYPHEEPDGFARGVRYLPEELGNVSWYEPSERGYEKNIRERMEWLKGKK